MQDKNELIKTTKDLNEKLSNLVFTLQKEVAELKEDTIINAQHLYMLKRLSSKSINTLNDELKSTVESTGEFVSSLEKENEKNGTNNYQALIKELLIQDFSKKQNELLEELKRELNTKGKEKKSTSSSSLTKISFILSLISFSLLMLIIVKFKLFSVLF